jgi:non-homologous end joining protein Ku
MRPYWKGYLKLALVSCPIALHAACPSAERIAFRQINKGTGNQRCCRATSRSNKSQQTSLRRHRRLRLQQTLQRFSF